MHPPPPKKKKKKKKKSKQKKTVINNSMEEQKGKIIDVRLSMTVSDSVNTHEITMSKEKLTISLIFNSIFRCSFSLHLMYRSLEDS